MIVALIMMLSLMNILNFVFSIRGKVPGLTAIFALTLGAQVMLTFLYIVGNS